MTVRAFSFGGGQQSTACLVLAAQGEIDFHHFLFCNVGEDSENPETLVYLREVAAPYAAANGIELHELKREWKDRRDWTLLHELEQQETLTAFIPVRLANGMPGRRGCTSNYKIRVTARWLKQAGATEQEPAVLGLGISRDEFHRARSASGFPWHTLDYPLLQMRLDRADCVAIIRRAGLPVPPKSSCWFCPFHTLGDWRKLRDGRPDLFERAVGLEDRLNEKRERQGKDEVYMTRLLLPLREAVGNGVQPSLFEDSCESGYCMT